MSHRFHGIHRFKATQKELVATLKIKAKIGLVRKSYVTYNWSIGENNKAPRVCLGALNPLLAERTGFALWRFEPVLALRGENNKAPRVCLGALNLFLRFAERTGFAFTSKALNPFL